MEIEEAPLPPNEDTDLIVYEDPVAQVNRDKEKATEVKVGIPTDKICKLSLFTIQTVVYTYTLFK